MARNEESNPRRFLEVAGEGKTILQFRPGEVVFSQGESSEAVYYMLEGIAKRTFVSQTGSVAVFAIIKRGELFGLNVLVNESLRAFSVTTVTDCSIVRLDSLLAVRLVEQEPAFAAFVVSFLVRQCLRMQDDLVDFRLHSSEKRLARALLLFADFGQDQSGAVAIPRMSHETLADMVGTTRSRVSVFMNKFRRLGLIDYDGSSVLLRRSLIHLLNDTLK